MTSPSYTDRLFTQRGEHMLYPRPEDLYECSFCAALGYRYVTGEVFAYHTCVRRPGHVWVVEGTRQAEGTGRRVFADQAERSEPGHVHAYDEDSDCLVCGESSFAPREGRP